MIASTAQRRKGSEAAIATAGLLLILACLLIFLGGPLAAVLAKSLQDAEGRFVGAANFVAYVRSASLHESLFNSLWISTLVTGVVVPLAFVFAYALQRSCMRYKAMFRAITLVPLLAPSLLSAISLIYWFGNQGVLKGALTAIGVAEIYGAPGIVLAECFAVFPHVLMLLLTALASADARLFDAARAMGTNPWRRFFTVTLPGARYGLISAALLSFTLVITDFGIPKVIGGNFNVLATDVFKLVIGQQDFQRGAVVALLLLAPALLTFAVDRWVGQRQSATLTAQAIPLRPRPSVWRDWLLAGYCALVALSVMLMLGMAVFASFASFWPYNLTPSWRHYTMGLVDAELGTALWSSLQMAAGTAIVGTGAVFAGAYLMEKTPAMPLVRTAVRLLAMLPMAVPGLVLGLGTIFFFNAPDNPLGFFYRSMALLTACTVVHFFTTGHLTAVTALKSIDAEFEAVSASLKVPFWRTFWRVTLPICTPSCIDIARYFFINAMTTISAVVFLYSPETKVASIAILNLDEAGETGAAAAMAVMITAVSALASLIFAGLARAVQHRTQAWRQP